MYKLVIFDLDGTLLDTLGDLAQSCNHALAAFGFPTHEPQAYLNFIGHGPVYLVTHALPESNRDDETVKEVRKVFAERYTAHVMELTKPYDGILETLQTLKDNGIMLAVYTNKPQYNAERLSNRFFSDFIELTVGFHDGVPPKPDPAAGFEIMRKFDVKPEETVFIGDSGVDMQTGKALGAYAVGVSWGFRPKSELLACGADVIIDKATELLKIVVDK